MDPKSRPNGVTSATDVAVLNEKLEKDKKLKKLKAELVQEAFDRILLILRQLGVYRSSPKLFVIYAHENDKAGVKAHQEVVRDYISWFKKALLNVVSDRSPHGYGPMAGPAHEGASFDIIRNQICLLPERLNQTGVDYILVFYSPLLAKYIRDEQTFNAEFKEQTYAEAVVNACEKAEVISQCPSKEIQGLLSRYSKIMGDKFHHVLTEMALLRFRNKTASHTYTIPIIIFDNGKSPEPQWQSEFINTETSQLWLELGSRHQPRMEEQNQPEAGDHQPKLPGRYELFFKILLMFESLERNRPLIEALRRCFEDFQSLLENQDMKPEEYRTRREVIFLKALDDLVNTKQGWMMKRSVDIYDIRDVLNLYCMIDRKSIQRVSGDILPESIDDIMLAAPVAPTSRDVHNLFDIPVQKGDATIMPRRILIHGQAGVGKTTLCRRIMYEYSWHENLRLKFRLVVRIPVRKLEYFAGLKDLLYDEYLRVTENGSSMSETLERLILGENYANEENDRILIILDGLDEVQHWSQSKRALLRKLMSRPDVIVTSRSYDTDIEGEDLKLEATGLSMDSVKAYLENTQIVPDRAADDIWDFIERHPFVKEIVQMPIFLDIICYSWGELQWQKADKLERQESGREESEAHERQFESEREAKRLKRSHSGYSTPENVSHGEDFDPHAEGLGQPGITVLYQAVIRTLWRKDIPILGKLDHGEPVTAEIIDAVQDSTRLERLVRAESKLLGEIAINMVESGRSEFADKDITAAIRKLETKQSKQPLSLARNLQKLSLIRSRRVKGELKYSFVHDTFQYFFAAQYLICNRDRIKAYLKRHKYNRRYEIVWRFVAGSLSDLEDLEYFFNLLDQEPRDIVGTQHINITMDCLSECHHQIKRSRQETILKRLAEWNLLETSLDKKYCIGASMAFPEKIICDQLPQQLVEKKPMLLTSFIPNIFRRTSLSENLSHQLLKLAVNNIEIAEQIQHYLGWAATSKTIEYLRKDSESKLALKAFSKKPILPKDCVTFFMEQIRLQTELQEDAKSVLGHQYQLPDVFIKELGDWLRSDHKNRRDAACDILSRQSKLPQDIVDFAIDDLCTSHTGAHKILSRRADIHPEAIVKILGCFERAAFEEGMIPVDEVAGVLKHNLQPGAVQQLETVLEQSLASIQQKRPPSRKHWVTLMLQTVRALSEQNLSVGILTKIVQFLRSDDGEFWRDENLIIKMFELQDDLDLDVINELRKLYDLCPGKAVRALSGRLRALDEAFTWALDQVTQKNKDSLQDVLHGMTGQQLLPDHVVEALTKILVDKAAQYTWTDGPLLHLISIQTHLSQKTIDDLVGHIGVFSKAFLHHTFVLGFYVRQDFIEPLMDVIIGTKNDLEVINATFVLTEQSNLDPKSMDRLRELLTTSPRSDLAFSKSLSAFYLLSRQSRLPTNILSALHEVIGGIKSRTQASFQQLWDKCIFEDAEITDSLYEIEMHLQLPSIADLGFGQLWKKRHMEQFCENLEEFDCSVTRDILREALLKRPLNDITPAYIDGDTLWYTGADKKLAHKRLKHPDAFRERFQEAQRQAGIPEWGLIGSTVGSAALALLGRLASVFSQARQTRRRSRQTDPFLQSVNQVPPTGEDTASVAECTDRGGDTAMG